MKQEPYSRLHNLISHSKPPISLTTFIFLKLTYYSLTRTVVVCYSQLSCIRVTFYEAVKRSWMDCFFTVLFLAHLLPYLKMYISSYFLTSGALESYMSVSFIEEDDSSIIFSAFEEPVYLKCFSSHNMAVSDNILSMFTSASTKTYRIAIGIVYEDE